MGDRGALKSYRAKRNFERTPEPAGGEGDHPAASAAPSPALAFVVQKHWATRLHYDFRLEWAGVMKSWAVPKGPSYDPHDKRLAVQVEDHPIAYNRFEGTIPKGEYGGGKVIIWDRGLWLPTSDPAKGLKAGKLTFELHGHKLHGLWSLVRLKNTADERQTAWLLIKDTDAHARPVAEFSVVDAQPDSVASLPLVPTAATSTPAGMFNTAPAESSPVKRATSSKRSQATPRAKTPARATAPAPQPAPADGPPPGARAVTALPAALTPQLATLVEHPPTEASGWLFEIKFDGYRMLARVEDGQVQLITRRGHDWTHKLPELAQSLRAMQLPDGWYDGEIVWPGERKLSDFQALQNAFETARTQQIVYYLFDLPFCAGFDLRAVPLEARRAVLQRIVERHPQARVRFSAAFEAPVQDLVKSACQLGLEGVMGKRRDSPYASRRSADWIKLKCGYRQEFVIGGYTDPQGSRTGIGSLLLGVHKGAGGPLLYAGHVGTGFSVQTLNQLRKQLDALAADTCAFASREGITGRVHWVQPRLVAEVAFGEWTREGRVRHATFLGLRDDKPPAAVVHEQALHKSAADKPAPAAARRSAALQPPSGWVQPPVDDKAVTHGERVIDTASGITKRDLVQHYAQVASLMQPHLAQRPVSLVRAPDGIGKELFFQKHLPHPTMPGIELLDPRLDPGHPPLLEVAEPRGLLAAAQMNVIEFHTWNAVKTAIATPDRMTFDIDPGENVAWPAVQEAAQLVRALLQALGLPAFLKTSGGKGLHVVVPLKPRCDWDTVKGFSQAVVVHLAQTVPQRFVAKSGPKNRVGKIFIDYLRNGFGATTVAAWSARARPGLGVSVPVAWDELTHLRSGAHWQVAKLAERLAIGNAPWADYESSRTALDGAMAQLGFSSPAKTPTAAADIKRGGRPRTRG